MRKIERVKKKGRPPETDKTKAERKELKELFQDHSTEALETVISIMKHSMNQSTRLKASQYVLDKVTPRSYEEEEEQSFSQEVHINLLPIATPEIDNDKIEQLIREVESEDDDWNNNNDLWETDTYKS